MRLPRNVKIGLLVCLVAVSPLLYTEYILHSHNWDPLKTPLILSPGMFQSPEFKTDLDGIYVVSLVFDEMPDTNREHCLIGWELSKDSCKDISQRLDFDWKVIGDVGRIQNGGHFKIYGMTGGKDEIEPMLGTFEAKRGGHQKIVLNILSDAGELNALHPRLKVEAGSGYWEKWVIFGQNAVLFALALGFVWTVTLLLHKVRAQPKISTPLFLIILATMIVSAYAVMRWISLVEIATGFGSELVPFALQESRNWGIAALVLEVLALALTLFSIRKQPEYWFARAALCILGTVGFAVLFYILHYV